MPIFACGFGLHMLEGRRRNSRSRLHRLALQPDSGPIRSATFAASKMPSSQTSSCAIPAERKGVRKGVSPFSVPRTFFYIPMIKGPIGCRLRLPWYVPGFLYQPISGPMLHKLRFFLPGVPVQVAQRGNNLQPIVFDDFDYRAYLKRLKEASERWSCRIHAYVLMTNHVHLLLTSDDGDDVGRTMQYLGRRYVSYIQLSVQRNTVKRPGQYRWSSYSIRAIIQRAER